MKWFYILAAGYILFRLLSRGGSASLPSITPQALAEAVDAGENWVLVDVRPKLYFDQGYIPGSVNWPLSEIDQSLDRAEPWKDRRIVLICHSGLSARGAVRHLLNNGFEDVVNLKGGVTAWRKATGGAGWVTPEQGEAA